jgi:hypothetical protein
MRARRVATTVSCGSDEDNTPLYESWIVAIHVRRNGRRSDGPPDYGVCALCLDMQVVKDGRREVSVVDADDDVDVVAFLAV